MRTCSIVLIIAQLASLAGCASSLEPTIIEVGAYHAHAPTDDFTADGIWTIGIERGLSQPPDRQLPEVIDAAILQVCDELAQRGMADLARALSRDAIPLSVPARLRLQQAAADHLEPVTEREAYIEQDGTRSYRIGVRRTTDATHISAALFSVVCRAPEIFFDQAIDAALAERLIEVFRAAGIEPTTTPVILELPARRLTHTTTELEDATCILETLTARLEICPELIIVGVRFAAGEGAAPPPPGTNDWRLADVTLRLSPSAIDADIRSKAEQGIEELRFTLVDASGPAPMLPAGRESRGGLQDLWVLKACGVLVPPGSHPIFELQVQAASAGPAGEPVPQTLLVGAMQGELTLTNARHATTRRMIEITHYGAGVTEELTHLEADPIGLELIEGRGKRELWISDVTTGTTLEGAVRIVWVDDVRRYAFASSQVLLPRDPPLGAYARPIDPDEASALRGAGFATWDAETARARLDVAHAVAIDVTTERQDGKPMLFIRLPRPMVEDGRSALVRLDLADGSQLFLLAADHAIEIARTEPTPHQEDQP